MENELFEKAPIPRAYFTLAVPVVLGMVVSLIYNMADTFFIAQTGNTALVAGVSLGAPVFTLMIALGDIFGLGGSSVISRLFGAGRNEDGKRTSAFCFWAAIGLGVAVAAIMLLFRNPILRMLGTEEATFEYARAYYTGIAIGAPVIIAVYTPTNVLRSDGLAVQSMLGTVGGTVVNIVLDPLFISAMGWGAAGAAAATVIGNAVTLGILANFTTAKSTRLSISPLIGHVSASELREILAIGIPASVTNLMQSLSVALTNRFLIAYGTSAVAAMGIALKVNMITALVLIGFAFGGQPLVGFNYGAGNRERLRSVLKFAYGFMAALSLVLSIIVIVAAKSLIQAFLDDPAIVALGVPMLRAQQLSMVFMGFVLVSTCIFQSIGDALGAFLLSMSRQGVIFAVVLVAANALCGIGGVIAAQPISDVLTALLALVLLHRQSHSLLRK